MQGFGIVSWVTLPALLPGKRHFDRCRSKESGVTWGSRVERNCIDMMSHLAPRGHTGSCTSVCQADERHPESTSPEIPVGMMPARPPAAHGRKPRLPIGATKMMQMVTFNVVFLSMKGAEGAVCEDANDAKEHKGAGAGRARRVPARQEEGAAGRAGQKANCGMNINDSEEWHNNLAQA